MKKHPAFVFLILCIFLLSGCSRSMNSVISNEPSINGTVTQVTDSAILIGNDSGEYWVSLDVELKDSMTHFSVGDTVVVYYDGMIAESYPMQINTVYAITLLEPADRTENEKT